MFFTKEDLDYIKEYLKRDSIKDSDLPEITALNGAEQIVLVQDSDNVIIRVSDFIKNIIELQATDFINISYRYNIKNITLKQAIDLIPSRAKKEGQVITFVEKNKGWKVYQFVGSLPQWNTVEKWKEIN